MRRQTSVLSAVLLALGFLLAPAHATVLSTYNDLTGFTSANSLLTSIDFSTTVGVQTYQSYSTAAGLTVSGVTFVGVLAPATYFLYANSVTGGVDDYGSGAKLLGPDYRPGSYLSISLPNSVTAFGIELMTVYPAAQSFVFTVDGVVLAPTIFAQANPDRTFFGFTSDTAISQIQISLASGTIYQTQPLFDNVVFGTAGTGSGGGGGGDPEGPPEATPEITTLLYMGTGIAMLVFGKRFRSRTLLLN